MNFCLSPCLPFSWSPCLTHPGQEFSWELAARCDNVETVRLSRVARSEVRRRAWSDNHLDHARRRLRACHPTGTPCSLLPAPCFPQTMNVNWPSFVAAILHRNLVLSTSLLRAARKTCEFCTRCVGPLPAVQNLTTGRAMAYETRPQHGRAQYSLELDVYERFARAVHNSAQNALPIALELVATLLHPTLRQIGIAVRCGLSSRLSLEIRRRVAPSNFRDLKPRERKSGLFQGVATDFQISPGSRLTVASTGLESASFT